MHKGYFPTCFRAGFFICFVLLFGCVTGSDAQIISTFAGGGAVLGDGGPATAAMLDNPLHSRLDGAGNLYIADDANYRVRRVNTSNIITTIAGNGSKVHSGDGGPATAAGVGFPHSVDIDNAGNIYFAEADTNGSFCIRKVNTAGIISTIAGNGTIGFSGDGGPATAAQFEDITDVASDGAGNIYVTDRTNHRIRKINTAGIVFTVAGNGSPGYTMDGIAATASELNYPYGVAVDISGNIYIGDAHNSRVRKVNAAGIISTIAGTGTGGYSFDGIAATSSKINNPEGLAIDDSGNVYIADHDNSRVREVSKAGIITTIAGNGTMGYSGDGGLATVAELMLPSGVAVDGIENVYVTDVWAGNVRKVFLPSIMGPISVCTGSTASLSDMVTGGTWTSSNTAIATIGLGTGIVFGVSVGTASITYNISGRIVTGVISVLTLPTAGTVTGASTICAGSTTVFSDIISGGSWSSANSLAAVYDSAITGVSAGIDTIIYTVTNICGAAIATETININPLPSAGTITGTDSVCSGKTVTLTDTVSGGGWIGSNTHASVSGGMVSGLSVGIDTIIYTVSALGCSASASHIVNVKYCPSGVTSPLPSQQVERVTVFPNPNDGTFTINFSSPVDEAVRVVITNIVGERAKEFSVTSNETVPVTIEGAAGVYFLSVVSASGLWSAQVMVGR